MNFKVLVEEYQKEMLRTTGGIPNEIKENGPWFDMGNNHYRKSEMPDMIARLKIRPDAVLLGTLKQGPSGLMVHVPYRGFMVDWPVNPAQSAALDLEPNLEVKCNIKKEEAPFCNIVEVVEPYGHCAVCRKRFASGEKHLRVSVIVNYKSQGLPDQFEKLTTNFHPHCFTPEIVQGLCDAEIVNKKP